MGTLSKIMNLIVGKLFHVTYANIYPNSIILYFFYFIGFLIIILQDLSGNTDTMTMAGQPMER